MRKIGSRMERIAAVTVFFAAVLDFAIECARVDLWIMAIVVVILMGSAKGTLA